MTITRSTPSAVLAGAVALALLLVGAPVAAGDPTGAPIEPEHPAPWEGADVDRDAGFAEDLWFVEFASPPEASGGDPGAQANERAQFDAEARQAGLDVEARRDFGTLWNGMSVHADAVEAAALRRLDSVADVYPVAIVEGPEPDEAEPQLASALAMTGADAARSELGFTGDGLSVAVIDTGIDYRHPDLGGSGDEDERIEADDDRAFDHDRISHGWDYVGEEFDPSDPDAPTEPDPDPDPLDLGGHGTHVAGIVGADAADDDGITGVAPGVTFGAYKVFGPGSTTADVIVEALEDARDDDMDIVNMSLGAAFAWGQDYPTTAASNELVDDGIAVVNSAGNSGPDGTWSLSAPANAENVISVASADNEELLARVFEVDQLDDDVPFLDMTGAPEPPGEGESDELAWLGRACVDSEGDDLLDDPDGRTALIVRGDCTFAEKYDAAVGGGATGVVIFNDVAGLFAGTVAGAEHEGEVWAAGIGDTDGQALVDLIGAGEAVTLGFTDEVASAPSPTGGLVSSFSSYGMDPELNLHPGVLAPGGLITSTYPLHLDGEAMLSGTSMSAPHVAGAAALLWEADPGLEPLAIRDRLQNTAEPVEWSLAPGQGLLDHTFRQGAGMIQVDDAITREQSVEPAQLEVGDAGQVTVELTVTNHGNRPVEYTVGHDPALTTAISTYAPTFFLTPEGSVAADPETVRLTRGASATVQLTVTAPSAGMPNHQYGGYVTLTPDRDDADVLRVPYAGYDGDYADDMALLGYWDQSADDPGFEFVDQEPRLSRLEPDGSLTQDPRGSFDTRRGQFPVVEAFFGHFPRVVEIMAVDERTGDEHLVELDEFHPRSPQPGDHWPFVWDGTRLTGDGERELVPSGRYHLRLEALRAEGDPGDAAHVDTWESRSFRIAID